MMIIDSQVHAYEANTPKRPWATVPNWPAHVTGDEVHPGVAWAKLRALVEGARLASQRLF